MISPAALALMALVLALVLSMTTRVNVGLLGIALAWSIGVYAAGLTPGAVIGGFPASIFITLAGVTLLFAIAKSNGTLELLARYVTTLARGHAALIPFLFFIMAGLLSSIGPGAISSVALVAPIAMATAARSRVSNLLMAVMVGTGANAGNLTPLSAVGGMVNVLMVDAGIPSEKLKVFGANFIAHVIVALAAYLLFGGWRLLRTRQKVVVDARAEPPERRHWLTMAVTGAWMFAVIVLGAQVGLSAFAAATILILLRTADEQDAIRNIPLEVILMVTGVTVLIGVLEATGGLDLFTGMLARITSPATINATMAFVTGVISTYSSTSGVVLPAFIPMVPGLVREVGGSDPLALALSINVGASLVDVSPLSTLGALCVAAVADRSSAQALFRQLLIWGLSMAVAGALMCGLLAPWFARL